MGFDSVDEILDYAIEREQEAADFYSGLADKMEHRHMKSVFLGFSAEEQGHRAKLLVVKAGQQVVASDQKIQDLKIGDYLVDIELRTDLSYQEALILAMKAEKVAFRLYNDLATVADDSRTKSLFLGLAQEEAKHKLRFEIEYDDVVLTEN